jgi:hypothetical protein
MPARNDPRGTYVSARKLQDLQLQTIGSANTSISDLSNMNYGLFPSWVSPPPKTAPHPRYLASEGVTGTVHIFFNVHFHLFQAQTFVSISIFVIIILRP